MALCPIIRVIYFFAAPSLVEEEICYRFETIVDALAIGCMLAGLYEPFVKSSLERRFAGSWFFVLGALAVIIASMVDARRLVSLACGVTVQNIGIAACLAWALTFHSSPIGRFLNSRPLVFIGGMSYSIYLWQQLFFNPMSNSALVRFPANILMVVVASLASSYLIEKPSLELRRRIETRLRRVESTSG